MSNYTFASSVHILLFDSRDSIITLNEFMNIYRHINSKNVNFDTANSHIYIQYQILNTIFSHCTLSQPSQLYCRFMRHKIELEKGTEGCILYQWYSMVSFPLYLGEPRTMSLL